MISILRRVLFVKVNFFSTFSRELSSRHPIHGSSSTTVQYLSTEEEGEIAMRLYNSMEYPEIP